MPSLPTPTSEFDASSTPDPELVALPTPPKRGRTAAAVVLAATGLAALSMAFALRSECRYAFAPGEPTDLGELATFAPRVEYAHRYVRGSGLLGTTGAIKYTRAAEGDGFRLAPIAGNPKIWVEIRVPEGFEGPRFVPPSRFAGRLVRLADAGVRHAGLAGQVRAQTDVVVPDDAWLLVDGSSPRSSRWAVALVALFLGFAGWTAFGLLRVLTAEGPTGGRSE